MVLWSHSTCWIHMRCNRLIVSLVWLFSIYYANINVIYCCPAHGTPSSVASVNETNYVSRICKIIFSLLFPLSLRKNCNAPAMSIFGTNSGFGTGGTSVFGGATTDSHNPMKVIYIFIHKWLKTPHYCWVMSWTLLFFCFCFYQDVEVTSPPDDSISCLAFSPPTMPGNFLIGGSWANDVSVFNSGGKKGNSWIWDAFRAWR